MPEWKELIRRRLAELNMTPEREAEIAEELAQHAEDRYEELKLAGVSDAEALRLTLNEVLDEKSMASGLRDVERTGVPEALVLGARAKEGHFLSGLAQDLRYGIRTLRKNAGFTAVAILTLGIGIGASTAIFSVVNGVLLQPLAYPASNQLLDLYEKGADFSYGSVAYPNYLDWRRESHSFSGMGAYTSVDFNLTGSGQPEQVSGEYVTASLFPVLGLTPPLGRLFRSEEDKQGAGCTVMLSYNFWQGRASYARFSSRIARCWTFAPKCRHSGGARRDGSHRQRPGAAIPCGQCIDLGDYGSHERRHGGKCSARSALACLRSRIFVVDCLRECGELAASALGGKKSRICHSSRIGSGEMARR